MCFLRYVNRKKKLSNGFLFCFASVENLAYKKRALISTSARHSKREVPTQTYVPDDRAGQAVDGRLEQALRFCTILDNLYGDVFTIDLGKRHKVSGVVILTWQGEGEGTVISAVVFTPYMCKKVFTKHFDSYRHFPVW